jgi:hypothetical protein
LCTLGAPDIPLISMNFRMEMNTDRGIFVSGSPNGSRYTERNGRLLKYGNSNHEGYNRS